MPRPKGSKNKEAARSGKSLNVRLHAEERELLDTAAAKHGQPTSDYVRDAALLAARKESGDGRDLEGS